MLWATRRKIRISRAATAWLVRRFVDQDAEFFFGSDEEVLTKQSEGAIGFFSPGTRYPKKSESGLTPMEAIVAAYCPHDPVLVRMAQLVRDADGAAGKEQFPEASGLRLMTVAFPDICADDHEIVRKSAFLYDSLHAALKKVVAP